MHRYRVVERWPDGSRLGLQCQMGRYHLVQALGGMPAVEAMLNGDKPQLGSGMLSCTLSGRIFRVVFESINQAGVTAAPNWMAAAAPALRAASRASAGAG
jgi:hypothetical protein